jgi:hypothetical protein
VGRISGSRISRFNTNITTLDPDDFGLQTGWGVSFSQQADGFGRFDVNTGDAPGGGQNRYDPVTFTITDSGISSTSQFFFLSELPAGHGQGHFGRSHRRIRCAEREDQLVLPRTVRAILRFRRRPRYC